MSGFWQRLKIAGVLSGVTAQLCFSLFMASPVQAISANITQIEFINSLQTIDQDKVTGQLSLQFENSLGKKEALDQKGATLTITSNSPTGRFSENGTSGWSSSETVVYGLNNGWAAKNFYYTDPTAGSVTLRAAVNGGGVANLIATQMVTVLSTATPPEQTPTDPVVTEPPVDVETPTDSTEPPIDVATPPAEDAPVIGSPVDDTPITDTPVDAPGSETPPLTNEEPTEPVVVAIPPVKTETSTSVIVASTAPIGVAAVPNSRLVSINEQASSPILPGETPSTIFATASDAVLGVQTQIVPKSAVTKVPGVISRANHAWLWWLVGGAGVVGATAAVVFVKRR